MCICRVLTKKKMFSLFNLLIVVCAFFGIWRYIFSTSHEFFHSAVSRCLCVCVCRSLSILFISLSLIPFSFRWQSVFVSFSSNGPKMHSWLFEWVCCMRRSARYNRGMSNNFRWMCLPEKKRNGRKTTENDTSVIKIDLRRIFNTWNEMSVIIFDMTSLPQDKYAVYI